MATTPREGHEPCKECSGEKAEGERKRPQNDPGVKRRGAPPKQNKGTARDVGAERNGGLPGKPAMCPLKKAEVMLISEDPTRQVSLGHWRICD